MTDPALLDRLWPDMCAIYRDAHLAGACLDLQDNHDTDVPLLLLLCLADRAGIGPEPGAVPALDEQGRAWREAAILPLRGARRAMKGQFSASPEISLREDIKRLELQAERLHVQRLASAIAPSGSGSAAAYLHLRGVPPAVAASFLTTFAGACDAELTQAPALD